MKLGPIIRAIPTGTVQDFKGLASLASGYLITGAIPRKLDPWAISCLLKTSLGVRRAAVQQTAERMQMLLSTATGRSTFDQEAVGFCEMDRELQWIRWRALHGKALPLETSIDGWVHIKDALGAGKGVVLWGLSFCGTLVAKVALDRAGVGLVHLSSADHGASVPTTALGYELCGPVYCVAENRFIKERVIIPADGSLSYMRTLLRRLAENQCVYVAGERTSPRNNVGASVLGREVEFAPGAPGLSWKVGSVLMPVHVIREGPLRYKAVVGKQIDADRGSGKAEFVRSAVTQFARYLQELILRHPSDWDWRFHTVQRLLRES